MRLLWRWWMEWGACERRRGGLAVASRGDVTCWELAALLGPLQQFSSQALGKTASVLIALPLVSVCCGMKCFVPSECIVGHDTLKDSRIEGRDWNCRSQESGYNLRPG